MPSVEEPAHGHYSVWVTSDVLQLVMFMRNQMGVDWELIQAQDVDDKVGNGFTVVLRVRKRPQTPDEPPYAEVAAEIARRIPEMARDGVLNNAVVLENMLRERFKHED